MPSQAAQEALRRGTRLTRSMRSHFGKRKFTSMEDAEREAEKLRNLHSSRFRAYKCKWCEWYHIGRVRLGVRKDDK